MIIKQNGSTVVDTKDIHWFKLVDKGKEASLMADLYQGDPICITSGTRIQCVTTINKITHAITENQSNFVLE